jgi:hypothetical protein
MQLEGKCVAFGREANKGSILVEGGKSIAVGGGGAALNGRCQEAVKVHVLHSAERHMMVASSILVEGGKSIDVGGGAALE